MNRIEHDADHRKFLLYRGDEPAARIVYSQAGDVVTIEHTITEPEFQGQGLAGELTAHVLKSLRERGLRLVPRCPYTKRYLEKHPEDADLVAETA